MKKDYNLYSKILFLNLTNFPRHASYFYRRSTFRYTPTVSLVSMPSEKMQGNFVYINNSKKRGWTGKSPVQNGHH